MVVGKLVEVACKVCGSEETECICRAEEVEAHLEYLRWFHRRRLRDTLSDDDLADRADFTQNYSTDIAACRRCRLVYRNPRPTAEVIARAYARDQYGMQRLASLFQSQVDLYRPKARLLRRWLPRGARVVEVGSFVGGFLIAGRDKGWRMLGVDPGEEVDAFCRERGLSVFRGTLPDLARHPLPGWESGSADCVAVWNAFDQLPDPEPTLEAACRLLRPGGLLALRVPNGECFRVTSGWMRRLPKPFSGWLRALLAWNNLLAFPYLYGYSVFTLDWLLGWYGFVRLQARPDTLCRLSDDQTKGWAAWEERGLKLLARSAASVDSLRPGSRLTAAPWLDALYVYRPGGISSSEVRTPEFK